MFGKDITQTARPGKGDNARRDVKEQLALESPYSELFMRSWRGLHCREAGEAEI